MVQVRLVCEPLVVFTSAMAFMGFCYQMNAWDCIHRLAPSPQIAYYGLNLQMEASHLTPKITNLAGKDLCLELLKGAKQYSRSAEEPGIEPRCP